jgi:hypothetical protein
MKITKKHAEKVATLLSCGVIHGDVGARAPGQMCVEAVISAAFGEPEINDRPKCSHRGLARLKVWLNDLGSYRDDLDRANNLRHLAIAQLGTSTGFRWTEFLKHLTREAKKDGIDFGCIPQEVTRIKRSDDLIACLVGLYGGLRGQGGRDAAIATADCVTRVLKKMKTQGSKFLGVVKEPFTREGLEAARERAAQVLNDTYQE